MKDRWKQTYIIWKKRKFDPIKKTNPGKEIIMERRSMWSRLLAVVLAVSMVFSSQSMSVFADVVGQITTYSDDANTNDDQQTADNNNDEGDNGNVPDSSEGEEPGSEPETQGESQPESSDDGTDEGQTATVQTTGTINGTNVNLRAQASTNAEILSTAQEGQVVSILGEVTGDDGNQWYEILYGEGSAFVSAQYVTVNETATDDESEEETQEVVVEEESESETPKKAARRAAKNADGDANAAKDVSEELKKLADSYFSDADAASYQTQLTVSMNRTDGKGDSIKTGDLLTYNISYSTKASPLFKYPSGEVLTLFDTYEGTEIRLKLPAGMEIVDPAGITGATAKPGETTGEWIFTLKSSIDASKGGNGSFNINVRMTGNGTVPAGTE